MQVETFQIGRIQEVGIKPLNDHYDGQNHQETEQDRTDEKYEPVQTADEGNSPPTMMSLVLEEPRSPPESPSPVLGDVLMQPKPMEVEESANEEVQSSSGTIDNDDDNSSDSSSSSSANSNHQNIVKCDQSSQTVEINGVYIQHPLLHQDSVHLKNNPKKREGDHDSPPTVSRIIRKHIPKSIINNKYFILDQMEGSALHTCIDIRTKEDFVCKVVERENGSSLLRAHYLLDSDDRINRLHEVIVGEKFLYLMFPPSYGDLHSYVRQQKRLKEDVGRQLFKQIVETVQSCHQHGIVLRDLKLRKFVFADEEKTKIRLETLDDAILLEDSRFDELQDKRGCPAYVSPEILKSHATYSGKAADMWSLGIILYTMLVGRYPFNDTNHSTLFAKISRGVFIMPEFVPPKARCLIRSLLRKEPRERLTATEILKHPWFSHRTKYDRSQHPENFDHVVPSFASMRCIYPILD